MHCESCGMPMAKHADFGGGKVNNRYCAHCCGADGALKPREQVRQQMVSFYLRQRGGDRNSAERVIDAYISRMPAWRSTA